MANPFNIKEREKDQQIEEGQQIEEQIEQQADQQFEQEEINNETDFMLNVSTIDKVNQKYGVDLKKIFELEETNSNIHKADEGFCFFICYPMNSKFMLKKLKQNSLDQQEVLEDIFDFPRITYVKFPHSGTHHKLNS